MRELANGEMPIMLEILIINFAKGASRTGSVSHTGREKINKLGNEKIRKYGGLRSSKDIGRERKRAERKFDEKML